MCESITTVSTQQVRNKFVTSWRGQKSIVPSIVSQIPLQRLAGNLLATSPSTGKLRGIVSNGYWTLINMLIDRNLQQV